MTILGSLRYLVISEIPYFALKYASWVKLISGMLHRVHAGFIHQDLLTAPQCCSYHALGWICIRWAVLKADIWHVP